MTNNPLFLYAEGYAHGRGYRFGDSAGEQIRALTADAWQQSEGNPSSEEKAKKAFARLVGTMIDAIEHVYPPDRQALHIIGEDTLDWAKRKLCPIWPICDRAYP